jgi:hypothetical protein
MKSRLKGALTQVHVDKTSQGTSRALARVHVGPLTPVRDSRVAGAKPLAPVRVTR